MKNLFKNTYTNKQIFKALDKMDCMNTIYLRNLPLQVILKTMSSDETYGKAVSQLNNGTGVEKILSAELSKLWKVLC